MTVDELRSLLLMLGFRPELGSPEFLSLPADEGTYISLSIGEPVGHRNNLFRVQIRYQPFIFRNTPEKRHEAFLFITTRLEELNHE